MLCCWKKTGETKTLSKPLLSEPKSSTGAPKFVAERKLTGFESMPVPEPQPKANIEPKEVMIEPKEVKKVEVKEVKEVEEITESTTIKEPEEPINYQEFTVIAKPEPPSIIELSPEIIKPEQEQQKQRNEKKRSKSGRR